jgi:hypothetical protein
MATEGPLQSLTAHKVRCVVIGATAYPASDIIETDPLLKYSASRWLLKKVQMQGGMPQPGYPPQVGPGVLEVRRNERRDAPTPQMGAFQQPAACYRTGISHRGTASTRSGK